MNLQMAAKSLKEEEIADSTDWLATPLPKLSAVESALRCQVCKDFYTTPMITSCSHTFCSLCIRRCLNNDGKCPACRANDQELKLRPNWAMEELVGAFAGTRKELLEFARRHAEDISPKRKRREEVEVEESPVKKKTRSSGRTTRSSQQQVVVLDSEEDSDYTPDSSPKDGLVACPICQDRMTVKGVEAHLEHCDGVPPSKKRTVSTQQSIAGPSTAILKPIKSLEKLPNPHYSGMKDVQLRKKLSDQGISTAGTRQLMERRWTEWVLLWNSNCDSQNPRPKSDLKKQLDVWERTQGGRASTTSTAQITGAQIKDKDFDGAAWAATHSGSFNELIANARKKAAKKSEDASAASAGSNASTPMLAAPKQTPPHAETNRNEPVANSALSSLPPEMPTPNLPEMHTSPPKPSTTQSRFFQEPEIPLDNYILPPSSQFQTPKPNDNKDGFSSDIGTIRALQP